jgi:putative ABC transport system permease protein
MLRATIKSLLTHKLRLALSAVAVIIGVSFVVGSFIFGDTIRKTFTDLFEQTSADVTVMPKQQFDPGFAGGGITGAPQTLEESLVDTVRGVDGVSEAEGGIFVEGVQLVGRNGKVLGSQGAPGFGVDWSGNDQLSPLTLQEGTAPQGPDEIAIDQQSAKSGDLDVGDTASVILPRGAPIKPKIVGIFKFGTSGNLAGATLTAWDHASAQELLLEPGKITEIDVLAAQGVSQEELASRVRTALADNNVVVRTQKEQAEENSNDIEQGLSFINYVLLAFAGIALFVGAFIILNTFSMLVAQRTRELALLRAVGASRRQVTRSVLLEALAVGIVGSTLGLVGGLGMAYLLKAAFGAAGLELTTGALVFAPRTVVAAYLVGVIVTVAAAYFPARRAARVPPVAALRDDVGMRSRPLHVRGIVGAIVTVLGVAVLAGSFAASGPGDRSSLVGIGGFVVLVGVIILAPAISRPAVHGLAAGYPRLFGTVGRLSRENAVRAPRRTAATSSALMIGLAVVGVFGVLAASIGASIDKLVDTSLGADYIVMTPSQTPFTTDVADRLRDVDGVESVAQQRYGVAQVDGKTVFVSAMDPSGLGQAVAVDFQDGNAEGLAGNGVLVDKVTADGKGWKVGDTVRVLFQSGPAELKIGGIFEPNQILGSYVVSLDTLTANGGSTRDSAVYVQAADGVDLTQLQRDLESAIAPFPNVSVQDQTEFKESQRGQVNQLLYLIYGLVALAIVIAVLGIINTLALSVIERTREIGLLRAVGMSRAQLRRMVRLESVVISVFGAALGLLIGVPIGIAFQQAIADQGIDQLAIPWFQIVLFLLIAAVIGVFAAVWPARRAAKLDVLRAVTTD